MGLTEVLEKLDLGLSGGLAANGTFPSAAPTYTFPQEGVLDNFNRTENPLSDSSAWASTSPQGAGKVFKANGTVALSTQADSTAVLQCWNSSFATPVEVYFTVASYVASRTYILWLLNSPTNASKSGYYIQITTAGAFTLGRDDAGTTTNLTTGTQALATGNKLGLSISAAGLITAYINTGSWASFTSATDTTYTGPFYPGMYTNSSAATFDDFGGGTA